MELVKPQRRTNIFDYWNVNKKTKITEESNSPKRSITHLEDLSNELFYEIFNYLDMYHVYKGFYSLNQRLQNLLTQSSLALQINLSSISKSTFQQYHRQILMPNKHRIISLRISHPLLVDLVFSPVRIASHFIRLERLIFDQCKSKYLPNILHHLASLPHLSSLTIIPIDCISKSDDLYRAIFRLPTLKYCKVSLKLPLLGRDSIPLTSIITSSIEHLVVDHKLSLNQLDVILTSVPHLRRLSVQSLHQSVNFQGELFSKKLDNLTHVYLNQITIPFDRFESMSSCLFSQLEVLRLSIHSDREYLNAQRWEKLILFAMPQLRIFDFQYTSDFYTALEDNQLMYDSLIDQFSSPFWIKRQWFFAYQCYVGEYRNHGIFYLTNPYRRKEYIFYEKLARNTSSHRQKRNLNTVDHVHIQNEEAMKNCIHYFPNTTKLTLSKSFKQSQIWLPVTLKGIIPLKQLTTLVINHNKISMEQFLKLLSSSPNILTLALNCQPTNEINAPSLQQSETFRLLAETNKVTKVIFKGSYSIENITFLVALCPRMQHLTVDSFRFHIEPFVRFILPKTKSNIQHLCLLCIKHVTNAVAGTMKNLIESEELLDNYSVKHISNELYLWW